MNRQGLPPTGYLSRCHPALVSCLMLLVVFGVARAESPEFSGLTNGVSALALTGTDTRYGLTSLEYSSGFVPAPDGLTLEDAPNLVPQGENFGLEPNFRQHRRYWFYTRVENRTENRDWVLHISNFGFQQPRVLIRGADGETVHTIRNSGLGGSTDINTIGRAVEVGLQGGSSYLVVVELRAQEVAWYPYMALMSDHYYETWKIQQDFAFKLAIGVIIGLILLGFVCWALTAEMAFFWVSFSSLLMLFYYLEHSSIPAILWQSSYEKTAWFWLLMSSTLFSQLAFAASFLQVRRSSGRWYQVFLGAALITVAIGVAGTMASFKVNLLLFAFNYVVVWLVILGSGVVKVRTEGRYYTVYIVGWLPLVLSALEVILGIQGPKQAAQEITVSYKMIHVLYIQILHMFIHAVALMLRIRSLREEKLKMEYLSQAKSRFIAQSSHDLSQPLNSMRIFLEHLKPHVHGLDGKKLFGRLKNTHRQMSRSFKSIMDLGKLESGAIRPEVKPVSLADLFSRLRHEYRMLATEKGVRLKFQTCSVSVLSDPLLLERVLRNLISNAVKYTDAGKVVIGCRRRGDGLVIQVLDTGCGIDKVELRHIFDIYHRSSWEPKQADGSGIGLSIVRHISELLNHPVTVESTAGKGSCFSIRIPCLQEVSPNQQKAVKSDEGDKGTPTVALSVEDSGLRDRLAVRLERWDCSVSVFSSVEAAVQSGRSISVLLCDFASLEGSTLISEEVGRLAGETVAACICEPDTPLPDNWIALSGDLLPSQLRALLNVAARRSRSPKSLLVPA